VVSANIRDAAGGLGQKVLIKLIRNGKITDLREGMLPMQYEFVDNFDKPCDGYYRLDISCEGSQLLSNPIFFIK